jgi:serine/threonine protein phosphatase PrpC
MVEHVKLGIPVAVCKMQGWRSYQEDMAVAFSSLTGASEYLLCGVFDGHSGNTSSSHASSVIFPTIVGTAAWREGNMEKALIDGFMLVDESLRKAHAKDGTTAICAVIGPDKVWVANCGDSRGVLCRDGIVIALSIDHKPSNSDEAERIRRAGGYVDAFDPLVPRVMAPNCYMAMATSRTLGDFHFKVDKRRPKDEQIVSPKPTIMAQDRHEKDQFIILATDGVWDVMSNQDVCNFLIEQSLAVTNGEPEVSPQVQNDVEVHIDIETHSANHISSTQPVCSPGEKLNHIDVGELAKSLLARCLEKGTMDNCSVVIVDLRKNQQKLLSNSGTQTPVTTFKTHANRGRAALESLESASSSCNE